MPDLKAKGHWLLAPVSEIVAVLDKARLRLITTAMGIYSIRCDDITAIRRRSVVADDESDPTLFNTSCSTILTQLRLNRRGRNNKRRRVADPVRPLWNRDASSRLRCIPRISYDETYCGFDLPSAYLLTRPMLKRLHAIRTAPIPWF